MKTTSYVSTLFSVSALLSLGACVPEESWSRGQQEAVTTMQIAAPPALAVKAAEKAIRELDPGSVRFEYTDNGFRASRDYFIYFVLGAGQGAYQYQVAVTPSGSGSKVETRIYATSSAITATGATPSTSTFWQVQDAYQLLQDRVRYHAGLTDEWVSCSEAKARYSTNGAIEPMCLGAKAVDPHG